MFYWKYITAKICMHDSHDASGTGHMLAARNLCHIWRDLGDKKEGNAQDEAIWYASDPRTRRCDTNPKMVGVWDGPSRKCTGVET